MSINFIMQWNVQSYLTKFTDLKLILNRHQPACISLQETLIKHRTANPLSQYQLYKSEVVRNDGHKRGAAVIVHNRINHETVPLRISLQAVALKGTVHPQNRPKYWFSFFFAKNEAFTIALQSLKIIERPNIRKGPSQPILYYTLLYTRTPTHTHTYAHTHTHTHTHTQRNGNSGIWKTALRKINKLHIKNIPLWII